METKREFVPVKDRSFIERVKFNIAHFFKRMIQRIAIKNYKYIHRDDYVARSDYENVAIQTCRNLITKNSNTDLRVAPISGNRHIKNEPLGMVVFINETSVDIIKNRYPQNVPISPKARSIIINMFDNYAETYRYNEEEAVRSSLKLSLDSILIETLSASNEERKTNESLEKQLIDFQDTKKI